MRRPKPCHPAAFLVDQNRRIVTADAVAQRANQIANLIRRAAVAPEQDEADRIGSGKEVAFEGGQASRRSSPKRRRAATVQRAMMHPTLRRFSSPQIRSASAIGPV